MNTLFIGSWDLAGSYIASRMIREGNEVFWITDEEKDTLWDKKLHGKIYRGNYKREEYLRIMQSNHIETVVFMTARLREHYEEMPEVSSLMLQLTDVLNAARIRHIRKFIYLSSIELDYHDIYTPVMTDLAAGEMLCEAYKNAYGLSYLILRLGCVFGDAEPERMGYTGRILSAMRKNEKITSIYSGDEYIDAVYGEDVAVGVNRLLQLDQSGTYRFLTGSPLTFEQYYGCLAKAAGVTPQVEWKYKRRTVEKAFFVSDKNLKMDTGWMPFYLLQEKGMEILSGKHLKEKAEKEPSPNQERPKRKKFAEMLRSHTLPMQILEVLLVFLFISLLLNLSQDMTDLKYVDIRLLFVSVIACIYGSGMGILAILLACFSYIYSLLRADVDISYLVYNIETWLPFAVYCIDGAFIGYYADHHRDEKAAMEDKYRLLEEKYEFIKSVHKETLEIKGSLQKQIVNTKNSFGHVYRIAVELDSLKPDRILLRVVNILEEVMQEGNGAIYLINEKYQRYARLKACSSQIRMKLVSSLDMDTMPEIYQEFDKEKLFVNREMKNGYPDLAIPIYYQGKMYGFAAMYNIQAEQFTVYYQNLFKITVSLIELSLVKALEYEKNNHSELYYPGTDLLYPAVLKEKMQDMEETEAQQVHSYLRARVYPLRKMDEAEVSLCITSVIRGNDFAGINENGEYEVLLINMDRKYLDSVQKRFLNKGLRLEVDSQ